MPDFSSRPLVVLALGGNALSPPEAMAGADPYAPERTIIATTAKTLAGLIEAGYRLLVVHGNGPQVGRLLQSDPVHGNLDIHVAQTQGELGYLLLAALPETPMVGVLTRVLVSEPLGPPVKAVGPVLERIPPGQTGVRCGTGWRVTVASPRPKQIQELDAVAQLLGCGHVVAGGGGGIPVDELGRPLNCVVDKDWVASLFAVALGARHLVFATDVDGVYEDYSGARGRSVRSLSPARARAMIDDGRAAPGSMAPKLGSAAEFVAATGRAAHICGLASVAAAIAGSTEAGTVVRAESVT